MDSVPIGELARRTGLSADSLRHYERRGLLPPARRTPGGARRFSQAIHAFLRFQISDHRTGDPASVGG